MDYPVSDSSAAFARESQASGVKCVLDFEASGLSSQSYPIEIGLVLDNGRQYQALIAPLDDWQYWDPEAERLHGISRAELTHYGKSVTQVCREVNELCAGRTLYSDCWVFDNSWLNLLFARAGMAPRFSCTPIEMIVSEVQLQRFTQCKNAVAEHYSIAQHRALSDAQIIQKTLHMLQGSRGSNDAGLMAHLDQWFNQQTAQFYPSGLLAQVN